MALASLGIEDFYKPEFSFDFLETAKNAGVVTGITLAVAAAVSIIFPPVGLMLLGVGAVTAGGIIAGQVLIAIAITFSTEVAIDYTYSAVKHEYDYYAFQQDSKNMTNLPFPVNSDGSDIYSYIVSNANEIQENPESKLLESNFYSYAIESLELKRDRIGLDEKEKTLLALMFFINNEYIKAGKLTRDILGDQENPNSIIEFINSTSILYEKLPDYDVSLANLEAATGKLSNSDFKAAMYSIYLDRLFYRVTDRNAPYNIYYRMYDSLSNNDYSDSRIGIQYALLVRMLSVAKLEQQKILSVYVGQSPDVWESDGLIESLSDSLDMHIDLVRSTQRYASTMQDEIEENISDNFLKRSKSWEEEMLTGLEEIDVVTDQYLDASAELRNHISEIYEYREDNKSIWNKLLGLKQ